MGQYKNTKVMSHATRVTRINRMHAMFTELHELGYRVKHVRGLKQKHVHCLVEQWKDNGISVGSMKNRLSDLRFLCQQLKKYHVVQSNDFYGIGKRDYTPKENKALHSPDFSLIEDEYVRCSLELQRLFGLRAEECIKFIPTVADRGDSVFLSKSWTKGGIERFIPIQTEEQRYWLDRATQVAQGGSLIPKDKTYIQQKGRYYRSAKKAGIHRPHGLRHAYAQRRYKELTGWESPLNGGPKTSSLTQEQRIVDRAARRLISIAMGHSRITVTKTYCG